MDTPDPFDSLEAVHDEASFLAFLSALRADAARGDGWENETIETFIEAATAWAEARPTNVANPWRRCADILYAGKGYE